MRIAIRRAGGVRNVARATGLSESVVRKWRSGRSEPTRRHLVNIANAANVTVGWLAACEETPPRSLSQSAELDRLEVIVTAIRTRLRSSAMDLRPETEARLVRLVYELNAYYEKPLDPQLLDAMVELVTLS